VSLIGKRYADRLLLGILNFSIFWWLLFVAAYELPRGISMCSAVLAALPRPF